MKKYFYTLCILAMLVNSSCLRKSITGIDETTLEQNDWFMNQRMYPYGKIDYEAYAHGVIHYRKAAHTLRQQNTATWQLAGTVNIGGRLTDVEMHASSVTTMYAGAASGGVFKSYDAGSNWFPIFDQAASLSIGDIAIAPSDSNTLYVGTGEANAGGGSLTYDGAGIYKSTDAGSTWTNVGLANTRNTGRIAIDPQNPNRVFAATMGDLFGDTPSRGIYRTVDGGNTWNNVLFVNDSTGAIDVVIHPSNPDTVYACMWTRVRRPNRRNYGGPESGIYRSYDGGNTWTKLTSPFSSLGTLGRIGIDISKSNPNTMYAFVMDDMGVYVGVYKSIDGGNTWANVSTNISFGSISYWYGRIKIDPTDANTVYLIDFDVWKTTDGGNSWNNISSFFTHVDQHEIYVHPQNNNLVLLANDGGFYHSQDGGNNWTHNETLPITQFYTCEVDESIPNNYYGGTQDNGVVCTVTGQTNDWYEIWGGDGFGVLVDPDVPGNWIAESQYGGLSIGTFGVDPNHKFNWNTPFIFNPHNSRSMYLGANHLYKTLDQGNYWFQISPDLSNGIGPSSYPIVYATITTIDVAASDTMVIYAGTDDGNVQRTINEGQTWTNISNGLPTRWVTKVAADPRNAMDVYVTLSGYRYHDSMSHVYHSIDGGNTWVDIGANLPDMPVNDIVVDTARNTLYIATDAGVYFSPIGVYNWNVLGSGMPIAPVTDLRLHYPTAKLVAATYGRSMYWLDLGIAAAQPTTYNAAPSLQVVALPTLFHQQLTVTIYANQRMSGSAKIFDSRGKIIYTQNLPALQPGNNAVVLDAMTRTMASGVYYVYVATNNGAHQTIKCIKQ